MLIVVLTTHIDASDNYSYKTLCCPLHITVKIQYTQTRVLQGKGARDLEKIPGKAENVHY